MLHAQRAGRLVTMIVFVKEVEFDGKHGVYEEERREGRRFQVDLEARIDEEKATTSDELGETLDYRRLAEVIREVFEGESRYLVEKLAGDILARLFAKHASVREATVEIRKHAPDVEAAPKWVGVRLSRTRDEL